MGELNIECLRVQEETVNSIPFGHPSNNCWILLRTVGSSFLVNFIATNLATKVFFSLKVGYFEDQLEVVKR